MNRDVPQIRFFAWGLFIFLVCLNIGFAETVTVKNNGITYRADYQKADGKKETNTTFLITHGTLAHNDMEIIRQMSDLLREFKFNTLSINLSYGINNRKSEFYDCKTPHRHLNNDAINEIKIWMEWLKAKKPERIIPVGHSRGGNQTAIYLKTAPKYITHAVLFAPSTWNYQKVKTDYKKKYSTGIEDFLKKAAEMKKDGKGDELIEHVPFLYCDDTSVSANTFLSYYADEKNNNTPLVIADANRFILVFAGGNDSVVSDLPEKMQQYTSDNPRIRFNNIDTADHFFRDLNMDDAVEMMTEFIEE